MAALYDGDGSRVFTANRTEDTKAYQLFAEKKASPKTSAQGKESSIFWYGFGQNFIQALHVAKEELGRVWKDTWEDLVSAYHRKIAKDRADEEGLVVNPEGVTNMPGDGDVTYPSETGQALIPYRVTEETYDYYEVRNYVNDINQDYTQVLTGYDEKGRVRESYTYGITENSGSDGSGSVTGTGAAIGGRLDYSDGKNIWYYGYTGTGSVAQLTDKEGALATAYGYDAFGNTSVRDYTGNITGNKKITENYTRNPYTYNGEYTDASTGNQYLRARYYSPETGNFFTEDSYLGSLLEPLERNLYTYAENDPVNYRDPSGHGIVNKIKQGWNKVKSTAGKAWNTIKKTASGIYNKAKAGLNNYMNGSAYKSYFNNSGSSGSKGKTGASTGNGYVGKSSGSSGSGSRTGAGTGNRYIGRSSGGGSNGGISGNTSYNYVRYNRAPSYKLTVGGTTRYYHTQAEMNTARKVCETAERIKKGEKVVTPNPTAAAILAGLVATTVVFLTGGAAAAAAGAMGLEGFGAAVATTTITGTVGGATEAGLYSALMGNDANTVTEDAIKGGVLGGAIGAIIGGLGHEASSRIKLKIETPYGLAYQENSKEAKIIREAVEQGCELYRGGTLGRSKTVDAQFWATENPLLPGYADKYGVDFTQLDYIIKGRLKPNSEFVTRTAPGLGNNAGGGIEVVTTPFGVKIESFNMLD